MSSPRKAEARLALTQAETELWRMEVNLLFLLLSRQPVSQDDLDAAALEIERRAISVGNARIAYEVA